MKMTKKMMFLFLLFPMIFGTADLYAQVTIGSDEEPHSGAILDLRSTDKGLKLPAVSLTDVAEFELSGSADNAEGMTVYNTNDNTKGGRGRGIYIWNGTWIYSGGAPKAEIPVNRIIITSPGNVNIVKADTTLQLTDSILPANASNKKLAWSVLWSASLAAGKATVDDTGLVTPVKPGNITVRASAIDGSGASRDFALLVKPTDKVESVTVSSETDYSVEIGRTLQLLVAITPETAFPGVSWASDNSASAIVNADGLVTGKAVGTANITASASDDLTKQDTVEVTVTMATLDAPLDSVTIGSNKYPVYKFGTTTWMVANSAEGTPNSIGYGNENIGNDRYYSHENAVNACGSTYRLPTITEVNFLIYYINVLASPAERMLWFYFTDGGYRNKSGGWSEYQFSAAWWTDVPGQAFYVAGSTFALSGNATGFYELVRCVKK